ncbi:hypothetical protein [[Limnothrix rosea] IAM M-220]|nr:hypothetical protein [[Limnothrix rosea] IAM M-220]
MQFFYRAKKAVCTMLNGFLRQGIGLDFNTFPMGDRPFILTKKETHLKL